ncbi:hypothetical protein [uncultured Bacteroides sp.]|uniref:hypothetical protein n=1 Tax=uncultured Bacteroides sp. TaxID=162156 RepID=UPI002AA841FF|nr:hypothetical protein [uncultured Bacteroides sp.]
MVFNTRINFNKEAEGIAHSNHLQRCTQGNEVFYQSSTYGNFDGVFMKIRGSTLQIKCSLHKLYYKSEHGSLDNSQMFTLSEARLMLDSFFQNIGIEISKVKVTYYELGINLNLTNDPITYIELMQSVGQQNEKEMFNDANYQKNRQKTTEKSRNIRKVLKVYDKGFEARSKGRRVEGNILRLETIYRRQSVMLSSLINEENLERLTARFFRDWNCVEFPRSMICDKGIKVSQMGKAKDILGLGREEYLNRGKSSYRSGEISKKQWETIRVFSKQWDRIKCKFHFVAGETEKEYKNSLITAFQTAIS